MRIVDMAGMTAPRKGGGSFAEETGRSCKSCTPLTAGSSTEEAGVGTTTVEADVDTTNVGCGTGAGCAAGLTDLWSKVLQFPIIATTIKVTDATRKNIASGIIRVPRRAKVPLDDILS